MREVLTTLAVFQGRIIELEARHSDAILVLRRLEDAIEEAALLVTDIETNGLSACNDCGCTVEDGECVCPRPCHEGCRLCAEGEM